MDFNSLMNMANSVLGLARQAMGQYEHLKQNFESAKDTLSSDDQAALRAKLEEIHTANQKLAQELDANLAALEARG